MSVHDENDRLRDGTLPTDPFADTAPAAPREGRVRKDSAPLLDADPFAGLARAGRPAEHQSQAGEDDVDDDGGFHAAAAVAPELSADALHGLLGEIVRGVDPYTEAHPAGVLAQLLATLGCVVGRGPHFQVGPTTHRLILFVALVGSTARGRKGTSWDVVEALLRPLDADFFATRVCSGLVSGEGLIHQVRDAQYKYVRLLSRICGSMRAREGRQACGTGRFAHTEGSESRTPFS